MRVYGFEFLKSNVKVAKEDYNKWTKQQKGFKFHNSLEHFMRAARYLGHSLCVHGEERK